MNDLIVLAADNNMKFTLRGALERPQALGIRPISFDIIVHPNSDGGVRTDGPNLLVLRRNQFSHGLLVMDFEGSGARNTALELETELDGRLGELWSNAAKAVVIEPEVDIWMWGSDNMLHQTIGRPRDTGIRDWLRGQGFTFSEANKPERPKEAMERLLQELRRPRSSALYGKIAKAISLKSCTDPAFGRLCTTLQQWFPLQ